MIHSPLDQFEIRTLIGIITPGNLLDMISITNYSLYIILVGVLGISLHLLSIDNSKLVSSRWYLAQEAIYDTINNMVNSQIGGKLGGYYFPLIYSLFNFILLSNLISMIPYSFAISAQMVFIISLSLTMWIGVTLTGFSYHGLNFFSLFVPSGTPLVLVPVLVLIEMLSYSSRAISLGLRLSANILSGHLLMIILGGLILNLMSVSFITFILGFIPLLGVLAITVLEFAIGMIQSYVFCILLSGYIKDGLYLH